MNRQIAKEPIIGIKYHIKWAKSFAMVWQLKSISGETATLITKRGKTITCKLDELLEINKNINTI